jgi:hypothetical protein
VLLETMFFLDIETMFLEAMFFSALSPLGPPGSAESSQTKVGLKILLSFGSAGSTMATGEKSAE